jgi:hypothetical protein
MNYLIVKHRVEDFDRWHEAFHSNEHLLAEEGFGKLEILRGAFEPNLVVVMLEVKDMNKAKAFTSSQGASDSVNRGGVIGAPEGYWLGEV